MDCVALYVGGAPRGHNRSLSLVALQYISILYIFFQTKQKLNVIILMPQCVFITVIKHHDQIQLR